MTHTHARTHTHAHTHAHSYTRFNKHSHKYWYTLTYQKHKLKNIINDLTSEHISNVTGKLRYKKGQYMLSK